MAFQFCSLQASGESFPFGLPIGLLNWKELELILTLNNSSSVSEQVKHVGALDIWILVLLFCVRLLLCREKSLLCVPLLPSGCLLAYGLGILWHICANLDFMLEQMDLSQAPFQRKEKVVL
jgi:hypothetical protein